MEKNGLFRVKRREKIVWQPFLTNQSTKDSHQTTLNLKIERKKHSNDKHFIWLFQEVYTLVGYRQLNVRLLNDWHPVNLHMFCFLFDENDDDDDGTARQRR